MRHLSQHLEEKFEHLRDSSGASSLQGNISSASEDNLSFIMKQAGIVVVTYFSVPESPPDNGQT